MLTDQEKEKIRLEEAYRYEVRELLPKIPPKMPFLSYIPALFK
jgi:hypothetical protein